MMMKIPPPRFRVAHVLLLTSILAGTGCVSSARYRAAVAEEDRLAKENLKLQRTLAEERVRAQEAQDTLMGRRPDEGRGATVASASSPGGGSGSSSPSTTAIAPEGLSAPTPSIGDEDVTASSPMGGDSARVDGLLRVARSYGSAGKTREAIDSYTHLIADNPFSPLLPQALLERAHLRLKTGDRRGALEDFDTVAEAFPASQQASEARRQGDLLRH